MSNKDQLSRRNFLSVAAKTGVAIGVAAVARPASAKVPPSAVNYQPMPKGKARCDSCANWQPPSACTFVAGTINPAGWCSLYKVKH